MTARWALVWMLFYVMAHSVKARADVAPSRESTRGPAAEHASAADKIDSSSKDDDDDDEDDCSGDDCDADSDDSADSGSVVKGRAETGDASDDEDEADDEGESEESPLGETSGNVTFASDYILRGITQTDHQPAVQGNIEWSHSSGFFLGVYGSNVHFDDAPESLELDGYGGYSYDFTKDLNASLAVSYLSYFASEGRSGFDFPLDVSWRAFRLEVDYSPDWQSEGSAWYLQGGWTDKVVWDIKLGVFIGYSLFGSDADTPDYWDFRESIAHDFLGLEWSLTGVEASQREINDTDTGPRAIIAVSKSF